ncbi:MAG: stage III sporulation protein AF [Lachnospiraceae bacterium]|nr:stage III sporulation protein AF [Lachnospiraceae bacterium]
MNSFVESICKIGIFMIAAQAVIHFAPAAKYEKYMRLVVGIIVLLQFLVPINKITDDIDGSWEAEADWSMQLADMEKELERGLAVEGGDEGSQFSENFISGMEMEIKSRLNSTLEEENYSILKVNVVMDSSSGENGQYNMQYDGINNNGYTNYQLNSIQVYVMVHDDKNEDSNGRGDGDDNGSAVKIEKVHINKIGADEDDVNMDDTEQITSNDKQEENKHKDNKQKESARLREKFAAVLGVEERYMEVSIYGWTE